WRRAAPSSLDQLRHARGGPGDHVSHRRAALEGDGLVHARCAGRDAGDATLQEGPPVHASAPATTFPPRMLPSRTGRSTPQPAPSVLPRAESVSEKGTSPLPPATPAPLFESSDIAR